VIDPLLRDHYCKKKAVEKLYRWARKLFAFKYVIEHIPRESDICADILSRWTNNGKERISKPGLKMLQLSGASPFANEQFSWPSLEEIVEEQKCQMITIKRISKKTPSRAAVEI
jgi:hypothetical protein